LRRASLLLLGCALAGCTAHDSLVVVSVSASPPLGGISYIHAVANAGGKSMTYDIGKGASTFSLPPAKSFAFDVTTVSGGSFTVTVEARDSKGDALASGSGAVTLAPGATRDIDITLGESRDGGTGDLSLADFATPLDFTGCQVTVTCQSLGLTCGTPSNGCGGTLDCTPCQLNAIYQPLGIAGSNIMLEGKFNTNTTVNFPGGISAAATVMGPNRATVTVPTQVTSGSLTISSGGMTTPPLPFRRPAFALGLPLGLGAQYEQAEYARQTPSLITPRIGNSVIVAGNWLFVLGGDNGGGALDKVERALVNADGTLGTFLSAGTLSTASRDQGSALVGKYLYAIGGSNGSALQRVERAQLGANGLPGSFADAGVALTVPRSAPSVTIIGDFLYVIGGSSSGAGLTTVERAPINGDGTLGSFADAGVSMRTARSGHTSTVSGSFLYVVGGSPSTGMYTARVERAPINSDGTIGDFVDQAPTTQLMTARAGHQMQIIGTTVYVFAGSNGGSSIESAPIASDGSFGPFGTVTGVSAAQRTGFGSAIVGNYLYEIGGTTTSGIIDRGTINSSGAISSFATIKGTLPNGGTGVGFVVGNTFYIVEGALSQHAPINPDGTLGSFVADANITALGLPVVLGDYVYALHSPTSQRAPINDDGTIGTFSNINVTKTGVTGYSCLVSGSTVYSLGGETTGSLVETATVANDGSLTFSNNGVPQLPHYRTRGNAALFPGNAYFYLGYDPVNGGVQQSPDRGAVDATALAVTGWANTGTTPLGPFDPVSAVVANNLYLLAGTGIGTNVYTCPITDPTLGLAKTSATSQTHRRASGSLVTNSRVYNIGGIDDANSMNYTSIEEAKLQ
jgi:hypothetical protein